MCYCGLEKDFSECCERIHLHQRSCDSAESLMRSRYSAYVIGDIDYIIKTTVKNKRKDIELDVLKEWSTNSEWLDLRILNSTENTVDFIAYYKQDGELFRHYEESTFINVDNHWFYESGEIIASDKYCILHISRNENCPCGSGLKFKKCCSRYL